MLNLCCLKSLFRLSFCIPGQPLPLPPMIESKASYGAILLHQYISLWDVLPALLQVVTPLLMHPRPKRHQLLGAKGSLCSAFLSHEDEVGEFFFWPRICKGSKSFLSPFPLLLLFPWNCSFASPWLLFLVLWCSFLRVRREFGLGQSSGGSQLWQRGIPAASAWSVSVRGHS